MPDRLPHISIPLAADDPDVSLDLQSLIELTYNRGAYRDQLRYDRPCRPPLDPPDETWANELIESALKSNA